MFLQKVKHEKAAHHQEMILFASFLTGTIPDSKSSGFILHEREILTAAVNEQTIEYQLSSDNHSNKWRSVLLKGQLNEGRFTLIFTDILTGYSFSDQSARELLNAGWKFRRPFKER
jgi:hypothetical protein